MSLAKYVTQLNAYATRMAAMGWGSAEDKQFDIKNLSPEDKVALGQKLSRDLQPECLTCDGEIRGAKLQAKSRLLYAAKADLEKMGTAVEMY